MLPGPVLLRFRYHRDWMVLTGRWGHLLCFLSSRSLS
nr:MAG TPA: hypothetical protein [Caudoviricetes sp.]